MLADIKNFQIYLVKTFERKINNRQDFVIVMDLEKIKSKLSTALHPDIEHDGKNKLASM